MTDIGRNDPCPCGSGKKYKKCCGGKTPMQRRKFTHITSGGTAPQSLGKITSMMSQTAEENKPKEEPKKIKPSDDKLNNSVE